MPYKLSNEPPEGIYEKAKELWGVDFDRTIFTYGDTIHSKNPLTDDLLVHELVHVRQQTEMGKDEWWEKYFIDNDFRLSQEVEAYRKQYQWVRQNKKDRNVQSAALVFFAHSLSGPMYGRVISFNEACILIKTNVR